MPAACIPLVVHSFYSLCRGTASPDQLIARAVRDGYPALALTDRDNLYGAIAFYRKAREAGLKPILGAEITDGDARAVALNRTMDGYSDLCRILTRRMMDSEFSLARAITQCDGTHDGLHFLTDDADLARSLHPILPPNRLWLLLANPPRRPTDWRTLTALSRELGRACVASPDVARLDGADVPLERTIAAIREKALVTNASPEPGGVFPKPKELIDAFRDFPGALVANRVIREDCGDFTLTLGKPIFPKYPLPAGHTAYSYLFHLCLDGMRRRYDGLDPAAMRRLTYELEVIDRLGFPEYFIIVGDICRFAHESGIPTVGRGSGAGSIVAYLLGITNVCPLRYRLYFERFLHDKRKDLPDLDIDLCWRRRDDVINHAYRTYGADRVAMISTHNTFQARGAFRDVARAHGIAPDTVDRWSKAVPRQAEERLAEALRRSPRARDIPLDEPRLKRIVAEAEALVGAPRHLGIHCGGIVIGDRPIDAYVPLEEATKGIVVTQYEMHAIEAIGLVKIDLLGNRAISVISEAVHLVEESGGPKIVPADIPDGDVKTAEFLARGDTLGVFQIESPGMRNLLKQLATNDLNGSIAALSLIRPGPAGSGMKERFVRRSRGVEPVDYLDPRLKPWLKETFGVLLYEEDVMQAASTLAGISLVEGDLLRRAIAEIRTPEDDEAVGRPFITRAMRNGVPPGIAEEAWKALRRFGAYAFCKAHAAGYGVLAYQGAWLKAHHPAAFAVSILNNHTAMYDQRVHLEDARRHGVSILLPCVNRSGKEYALEEGRAIRIGLNRVRSVSETVIDAVLARRPFHDLADFLRRVLPPLREAENLILAGAFDFTGRLRPELLCELRMTWVAHGRAARRGAATGTNGTALFDLNATSFRGPGLKDFDAVQKHRYEFEVLELSANAHAMTLFDTSGCLPSRHLDSHKGRRVTMAGIVGASRRVPTKSGEMMQFLTLDDVDGLFECTLFPAVYRRYGGFVRDLGPYVVEGRAEDQYGAVTVTVEKLRRWEG